VAQTFLITNPRSKRQKIEGELGKKGFKKRIAFPSITLKLEEEKEIRVSTFNREERG
jgi:hypothetical protein